MTRFVTCALRSIRRHETAPEAIDFAILCAINATLCLASGSDDRVAEGFNGDIAASGRGFQTAVDYRGLIARQVMQQVAAGLH